MSHDRLPQRPARAVLAGIALALLSIAAPGGAHAVDARAEAREARRKAAATSLFAQVLRDQAEDLGTPVPECGLANGWSITHPIEAGFARRHLGLTVEADLLAPHLPVGPRDIFPTAIDRKAFCTEDEFAAFRNRALEAFRADQDAKPDARLELKRRSFGFPVFSRDHTRAVLVVTEDESFWSRRGGRELRSVQGGGGMLLYVRRGGTWRFSKRAPLFSYS
jgi:hypothetical protein